MKTTAIFHLVPGSYFHMQPLDEPYLSPAFQQEGFIHCTAGKDMLITVANRYFADLLDDLLVLQIDPSSLTSPLKFEPPIPPPGAVVSPAGSDTTLFPHIYGPLNRDAIATIFALRRETGGLWQMPPA